MTTDTQQPQQTRITAIDLSVLDWTVVAVKAAVGLFVAGLALGLPLYILAVIAGLA